MRILIADDSVLVRSGIADLLRDNGWEVCGEASNGTEAIQQARVLLPDLVLLDISMPGMGGLEIASALRRELPALRIVIVSQHDFDRLSTATLKPFADAFVDKGRLGTDLLPAITHLFDNA
jgi:two-component system, NarL family, invasion response regulator UvrY